MTTDMKVEEFAMHVSNRIRRMSKRRQKIAILRGLKSKMVTALRAKFPGAIPLNQHGIDAVKSVVVKVLGEIPEYPPITVERDQDGRLRFTLPAGMTLTPDALMGLSRSVIE